MYNADIKQRFLRLHPSTRQVFDHTRRVEELLGKDVAEMAKPEIIKTLNGRSDAKADLDAIRSYTMWCQEHGVFPLVNGGCFRVQHSEI